MKRMVGIFLTTVALATGTSLFLGQKAVSPDGEWAAAVDQDGRTALYPVAGNGPAKPIAGLQPGDAVIRLHV